MSTFTRDWFTEVPSTDEEAIEALQFQRDSSLWRPMVGIYQIRRKQNYTVLESYEAVLLASIGKE